MNVTSYKPLITNSLMNQMQINNKQPKINIALDFKTKIRPPNDVVKDLANVPGPVSVCCWYEGPDGQPRKGAGFMRENIFEPLYQCRKDLKLYVYSLRTWSFKDNVNDMALYTKLGNAINLINRIFVECIDSSDFFRYVRSNPSVNPCNLIDEQSQAKLRKISAKKTPEQKTVATFFNDQSTILNAWNDVDVAQAYSFMQRVEGFYLISNLIERRLLEGERNINIAFVLPNNESQYYKGLKEIDLKAFLSQYFGDRLDGVEVKIMFRFFEYKGGAPYNFSKEANDVEVEENDIPVLFNYLPQIPSIKTPESVNEEVKEKEYEINNKQQKDVEKEALV